MLSGYKERAYSTANPLQSISEKPVCEQRAGWLWTTLRLYFQNCFNQSYPQEVATPGTSSVNRTQGFLLAKNCWLEENLPEYASVAVFIGGIRGPVRVSLEGESHPCFPCPPSFHVMSFCKICVRGCSVLTNLDFYVKCCHRWALHILYPHICDMHLQWMGWGWSGSWRLTWNVGGNGEEENQSWTLLIWCICPFICSFTYCSS